MTVLVRPLDEEHDTRGASGRGRRTSLRPGWPLTALLVLYPLWWALGMGTLAVYVLAVPMVVHLWCRRPVAVPPGFGLWLLFLCWILLSTSMLGYDPAGTVPASVSTRIVSVAFNFSGYLAATVVLLYAGNLTEAEFPKSRLVRQLGGLFVVVLAGGLLGTLLPTFEFTSITEMALPQGIASNNFVRSLVHPSAAQLQEVLGYSSPRPSAPFGYTNTWGNCLGLLLGWFAVSWFGRRSGGRRAAGAVIAALGAIPVVYSLNRGLWIGLGLVLVVTVARLALRGRIAVLVGLVVALSIAVPVVVASPLTGIVEARLDNPKSNNIRAFTTETTLEVVAQSPVLGFGSTRAALGSSQSIAVGADADCQRCGNPTLGSNGQLWLLLVAQGVGGAALYIAFFARSLWAYRRDRTSIGDAGLLACGLPLFFMFVYNALTMPLVISFLSIALLWRNQRDSAAVSSPPGAHR
jgi:hypothetical protein